MKAFWSAVLLVAMVDSSLAAMPAEHAGNEENGTIVLVFKDGHRQSYPAASVGEVEYQSAAGVVTPIAIPSSIAPSRRRFIGAWLVRENEDGGYFTITLEENGEASKSHGAPHGTWSYTNGEARVSWDDGWHDVIRKTGQKYEKFAYAPGRALSDSPSNVTQARPKSAQPI